MNFLTLIFCILGLLIAIYIVVVSARLFASAIAAEQIASDKTWEAEDQARDSLEKKLRDAEAAASAVMADGNVG